MFIFLDGCTKDEVRLGGASLTTVHAVCGLGMLKTNFKGTEPIGYENATLIRYGIYLPNDNQHGLSAGVHRLGLFEIPDTLADSKPRFLVDLNLEMGSINTLYLLGSKGETETLIRSEQIPYYASIDSVMGLRFANLSSSKPPVVVTIHRGDRQELYEQGKVLEYKDITAFQRYPISSEAPSFYTIEFRHASTNELLASYTIEHAMGAGTSSEPNRWIYRNFTIALIGGSLSDGCSSSYEVMLVRY